MANSTMIPGRKRTLVNKTARHVSARRVRSRVAEAFRRMANGVGNKAAYASTVQFYRSGGQEWSKQLG
jgi:hypothetical protein